MSLYNLRSLTPNSYMIAKFDSDFNVESTYTLTASRNGHFDCDCPAGSRSVVTKPCRHRLMLPALLPAVDTNRFYDYDTKKFCEPLGDLLRPTAKSEDELDAIVEASAQGFIKGFEEAKAQQHDALVGEALRNEPHTFVLTAEEIVGLSDGVEKDFHEAMQSEGGASPPPSESSKIIAEAAVRQVLGPTIRRR